MHSHASQDCSTFSSSRILWLFLANPPFNQRQQSCFATKKTFSIVLLDPSKYPLSFDVMSSMIFSLLKFAFSFLPGLYFDCYSIGGFRGGGGGEGGRGGHSPLFFLYFQNAFETSTLSTFTLLLDVLKSEVFFRGGFFRGGGGWGLGLLFLNLLDPPLYRTLLFHKLLDNSCPSLRLYLYQSSLGLWRERESTGVEYNEARDDGNHRPLPPAHLLCPLQAARASLILKK